MNVAAYLGRIGYKGKVSTTIETLRGLHRAHLLSVPFENLDISLGRQILCNEDAFLRKIVERHRGGFCYEMNGAFAALLRTIGFEVTLLSARVPNKDGSYGPEFDHLALRVDLDTPWLADVGFGDSFLDPLRLETGVEQTQAGRIFRILGSDAAHRKGRGCGIMGKAIFIYAPATAHRRLRCYVPLPPDFAGFTFHPQATLYDCDSRRPDNAVGHETDRHEGWHKGGAKAGIRGGGAGSANANV